MPNAALQASISDPVESKKWLRPSNIFVTFAVIVGVIRVGLVQSNEVVMRGVQGNPQPQVVAYCDAALFIHFVV